MRMTLLIPRAMPDRPRSRVSDPAEDYSRTHPGRPPIPPQRPYGDRPLCVSALAYGTAHETRLPRRRGTAYFDVFHPGSPDPRNAILDDVDRRARRTHAQPQERRPRHSARPPRGHHRALRIGQVLAGLRHPVRGGPAALRGVALRLRSPVPLHDGEARHRPHRGSVAGPSPSNRSRHRTIRAPPSGRSRRSTTTCGCCSPGSASRAAPPTARPWMHRRSARWSTRSWRCRRGAASCCSRPSSATARASTCTCSTS